MLSYVSGEKGKVQTQQLHDSSMCDRTTLGMRN